MMIHTKLHEAIEAIKTKDYAGEPLALGKTTIGGAFLQMLHLPHYICDPSIFPLFESGKAMDSIIAMIEAGVARLPFPEVLVELYAGKPYRHFVILRQPNVDKLVLSVTALFYDNSEFWPEFSLEASMVYTEARGNQEWEINGLFSPDATMDDRKRSSNQVNFAAAFALLMSHVSGLAHDRVEPPVKLNKARRRLGKQIVPAYTVVRVGHVYDREGNKVAVTSSNRTMPVHMRSGHVRNQPYGKGRELRKPIWIAPVLVNYIDGSPLPPPLPKVVRA